MVQSLLKNNRMYIETQLKTQQRTHHRIVHHRISRYRISHHRISHHRISKGLHPATVTHSGDMTVVDMLSTSSWTHQRFYPCDQWKWYVDHVHEDPSNDGDLCVQEEVDNISTTVISP